jgi:hypothetical protein
MTRRRPNRRPGSRPASVSLEALFVLPVLLLVVVALVEFAMLLAAEQKLAEASGVAARTAAVGRSDADARHAVRAVLGDRQYDAAEVKIDRRHDARLGDLVEVRIDLPAKAAAPCVLRACGVKMTDDTLIGRTLMRAE